MLPEPEFDAGSIGVIVFMIGPYGEELLHENLLFSFVFCRLVKLLGKNF